MQFIGSLRFLTTAESLLPFLFYNLIFSILILILIRVIENKSYPLFFNINYMLHYFHLLHVIIIKPTLF